MILITCSSVFQLYVAILLKIVFLSQKQVDLILTDATPRFETLYKNKRLNKLFNSVKFVRICKNAKSLNRIEVSRYGKGFYELFPEKYVKKVWGIDIKKYDECFFSTFIPQNNFLIYAFKKVNKNSKVHLFEDGISTYLLKNTQPLYSLPALRKIFNFKTTNEVVDDVYLFEPELMCFEDYKLIQIPKPQEIDGAVKLLNEILNDNSEYKISERFVFFEESFNNDGYITNDAELINILYDTCNGEDFILKHHPRNSVDRFKTVLPTLDAPIFWENYLLNNPIDNHVLVTVSSNTVFVPHIISGACPTVVMLYKIFNGTSPILGSGNFEKYVEKYLNLYSNYTNTKFYIPETLEEFKKIILNLRGN